MMNTGYYIYSVIECSDERIFDAVPIGGAEEDEGRLPAEALAKAGGTKDEGRGVHRPSEPPKAVNDRLSSIVSESSIVPRRGVYTICHNGLAAVVSNSEVKEYPLTRKNMISHQKVNEAVMSMGFVVLPVKFCTIAESPELIVNRLLVGKREELLEKLEYLADKNEFGLKVLWKEMPLVFAAIVEENPAIKKFKLKLEKADPVKSRGGLIEIGEMVKQALDEKKEVVGGVVYDRLAKLAVEAKKNQLYGDKMPLNAAFLVARDKEKELDNEINKLAVENAGTMDWRYVGPTPAANFVEIVVTWED